MNSPGKYIEAAYRTQGSGVLRLHAQGNMCTPSNVSTSYSRDASYRQLETGPGEGVHVQGPLSHQGNGGRGESQHRRHEGERGGLQDGVRVPKSGGGATIRGVPVVLQMQ